MLERARPVLARDRLVEMSLLHPLDFVAEYERVNQVVPENIRRMIMLYPDWRREVLTPMEVGH